MARILVAGVVRNGAGRIDGELKRLKDALIDHELARIVIVESDSSDDSVNVLTRWNNENICHSVFFLGDLATVYTRRTERIAYCRNVYMKYFERYDFFGADYLFVTDLDGVNDTLTATTMNRVLASLTSMPGAAACANQGYKYYDIWALRHPIWSPNDCWTSFHALKASLGEVNAHQICNASRMIHIDPSRPPIEVDSAFGGGAVYDVKHLRGCRYEGLDHDEEICEHVAFSAAYRRNGGHVFVFPDFINHDRSEHVVNAEQFERTLQSASVIGHG